jgi:hypothetical protein
MASILSFIFWSRSPQAERAKNRAIILINAVIERLAFIMLMIKMVKVTG